MPEFPPFLDVREFGVVGDGSTDDTEAFQAAADACVGVDGPTLFVPSDLHIRTTAPVDLWRCLQVDVRGRVTGNHDGEYVVRVGYLSNQATPASIRLQNVQRTEGVTSDPDIRVVGLKTGQVSIGSTGFLQIYAESGTDPSIGSLAYSHFHLGRVHRLELHGVDGPGSSWINENTFYGGNIKDLRILGTNYSHNHNTFLNPVLENAAVYIDGATSNRLLGCRFEGGTTVELTDRTRDNVIERTWVANPGNYDVTGVTDNGIRNIVGSEQDNRGTRVEICRIDSSVPAINGSFGLSNVAPGDPAAINNAVAVPVPGIKSLRIPSSWSTYADTGLIPVVSGGSNRSTNDVLSYMDFSSDRSIWRPGVEFYNEDRERLEDEDDPGYMSTVGPWNWTGERYFPSGNVARIRMALLDHPDVHYVRVTFAVGASSTGPLDYARLTALIIPPSSDGTVHAAGERMRKGLSTVQRPTAGAAQPGDVVGTPHAVVWMCSGRFDGEIAAPVNQGSSGVAYSLTSTSITPQPGDVCGVVVEDGTTDWRTVVGVNDTHIGLDNGLSQNAPAGGRIVVVRWVGLGSG